MDIKIYYLFKILNSKIQILIKDQNPTKVFNNNKAQIQISKLIIKNFEHLFQETISKTSVKKILFSINIKDKIL